ncbi:nuclease-related domain-containing protein [Anabaena azotica]|uniref:nuclease-related domain-containing protein n=1 Tax=Anabaena azotica TaxID=197653 RepID=UPI0039A59B5C
MPKLNSQAGENVREMALKRRIKAITSFASAGFMVLFPFLFVKIFDDFLKKIFSLNSSQAPPPTLQFPIIFYALFIFISVCLFINGIYLWKRANHADQGAKGEEDIAQLMTQLKHAGWQIEYGMRLGNGLGDADIICISPKGKAYVIDVKSHRGEVTTDGTQLYKQMGKSTYAFEKNFLQQAMKQALQVKKQKTLNFVTPIVAFSNAQVSLPAEKLQNVYVVGKEKLIPLLKSLD